MPDNIHITPTELFIQQITEEQDSGAALVTSGTYNGTTCTAGTKHSTTDSIADRHHFIRLWDNFTDVVIFDHTLDTRYVPNSNISVDVYWTTPSSSTGSAYLEAGLCQSGADGILGNDTDTEYIAFAQYPGPTDTNQVVKTTFTFNGTLHGGIATNASACFILMRKGADALDTINDQFYITGVNWRYNINKL